MEFNEDYLRPTQEPMVALNSKGSLSLIRELTQPRRQRQHGRHKFAYLIVKNNSCARFARAVFIFDISQTFSFFLRRDLFCSCVDDVTI